MDTPDFRAAFRRARAGRGDRAMEGLNDYFRAVTRSDWKRLQREARAQPVDPALIRDLLRRSIVVAHGMRFEFGAHIDFASGARGANAVLWLQGLGWMRPLVHHYARTQDPATARFFIETLADFYESLPRIPRAKHYGYNSLGFDHGLPIWRDAWIALLQTGQPVGPFTPFLLRYVVEAGQQVESTIRRFILHNIHTAGCWALFKAARWFPELREAGAWERLALRYLVRHAERSFFPDGCHIERCWGYGSHTLRRLTDAYAFARATGGMGAVERRYHRLLFRPYAWFARTSLPAERCPGYGDDPPMSSTAILATGRKLFPRRGRTLGQPIGRSFMSRPSGFVFFRNGTAATSVQADLSFGEYAGWHAHFDSLNFNLHVGGRPVLVELSRFGSYDHPLDHLFRSPEAHNQMLVDGHPYDNRHQPACGDVAWASLPALDYFSATHRAYRPIPPPDDQVHRVYVAAEDLMVRRTVVGVKNPGYFVVLDSVRRMDPTVPFSRAVSGYWHAPAPFRRQGAQGMVTGQGGIGCLMRWARPDTIRRLEPGWDFDSSVECAAARRSYQLRARAWGLQTDTGINGLVTLIWPFTGKAPTVEFGVDEAAPAVPYRIEHLVIRWGKLTDRLMLNPERLPAVDRSGNRTRARCGWVRGEGRMIAL